MAVASQDFSGAGLGLLGSTNLKIFGSMSKIYQSHYPELMGQFLISNAPGVMSLIYKGFSIFMDQGALKGTSGTGIPQFRPAQQRPWSLHVRIM